ncbi:unnamed protein product, partial [Prorocentrum cordatum]
AGLRPYASLVSSARNLDIGERVRAIQEEGGWAAFPGSNCFLRHGSREFPDGSSGEGDGAQIPLDECLSQCEGNEDCDGVTVENNRDFTMCTLLARVNLPDCYDDEQYAVWVRGSIFQKVDKFADGWTLHINTNCFEGRGSQEFPVGNEFHDESTVALNECLLRCEDDPLCEGVSFPRGTDVGTCGLRAFVNPPDCASDESTEYGLADFWMLDFPPSADSSTLPIGGLGRDRMFAVVDMQKQEGFRDIDLSSCALVGASGVMKGSLAGDEIDSHSAIIRLNRLPTEAYFDDFGSRTDILFLSKEWSGGVTLMGDGDEPQVVNCHEVDGCDNAAIISRGDLDKCDPKGLEEGWGPAHPMVGCQHKNISRLVATGFSTLHGSLPSAGLQAFFTFVPLCGKLDLYGFGGKDTADGHAEWSGHNLFEEHTIQDKVIAGQWDDLPWKRTFGEVEWLRRNAGDIRKVIGTVP